MEILLYCTIFNKLWRNRETVCSTSQRKQNLNETDRNVRLVRANRSTRIFRKQAETSYFIISSTSCFPLHPVVITHKRSGQKKVYLQSFVRVTSWLKCANGTTDCLNQLLLCAAGVRVHASRALPKKNHSSSVPLVIKHTPGYIQNNCALQSLDISRLL